MEYLPDLTKNNISLFTIPIFWVIAVSPRLYAVSIFNSQTRGQKPFDGRKPRDFTNQIASSQQLDTATKGRLIRAEGASLNGFENFGVFSAAVVAANAAKLEPAFVNGLTLAYLASRVVYNFVYIGNDTAMKAHLRAVTYLTGLGILMTMFASAGRVFW